MDPILSTPLSSSTNTDTGEVQDEWDLLTSNPPYISPRGFSVSTSRSVRNWEPKLALVPPVERVDLHQRHFYDHYYPDDENLLPLPKRGGAGEKKRTERGGGVEYAEEDIFYARLLEIARTYKPKRVLMEVGDMEQAKRVVGMVLGEKKLRGVYWSGSQGGDRDKQGEEDGEREMKRGEVQIWRDDMVGFEGFEETMEVGDEKIVVRGHPEGHGRSVYLRRVGVVDL